MKDSDKGARAGNFIIDILVLIIIIVSVATLFAFIYPPIMDSHDPAFEVLASTIFFLYYFLFEFFTGKTIGKMLTKTMVVDKYGNKPSVLRVFARSLVRLIPVEGISFVFGPTGFHDLISGTKVVKVSREIMVDKIGDKI